MSYEKVLLINADYPDSHYEYAGLPVGLGYVSEALTAAGIDNEVFDLCLERDYDKLEKKIDSYGPDLIGYSLFTFRHKYNYGVMERIKRSHPGIRIIVGGPHLSTLREKVLEDCPAVDFGATLEGEQSLVELCLGHPHEEVKGLLYRDGEGKVLYTGDRPFVKDLESLPTPRYGKFDLSRYPKNMNIVSSRGCPHACTYCPVKSTIGRMLRVRKAESVAEEFEYWYKLGYRDFAIADDNFTFHQDRVYEFCDLIEKKGLDGIRISLGNGVRADKVNRDLLKRMKQVGFYYLAFGVEGGNDKVLKHIKKGEKIETIKAAVKMACDLDYYVGLFFLIGSPYETPDDLKESIDLALQYPICESNFYNLIPFPNTELYDWVKEHDYFVEKPEDYLDWASHWVNRPLFATPEFSLEERKKAYRYANETMRKHTKKRYREFEAWLAAEKLHDYYGLKGPALRAAAWVYSMPVLHGMRERLLAYMKTHRAKKEAV